MDRDIIRRMSIFFNSFDVKDWHALEDSLADHVSYDYSGLRSSSGVCAKEEFVGLRKAALNHLKTQHIYSNLEVEAGDKRAFVRLSAVIFRRDDADHYFNTHAMYEFRLQKLAMGDWKIDQIKQVVLWNEGDSSIHQGAI